MSVIDQQIKVVGHRDNMQAEAGIQFQQTLVVGY
jgi:hypothetical protein